MPLPVDFIKELVNFKSCKVFPTNSLLFIDLESSIWWVDLENLISGKKC